MAKKEKPAFDETSAGTDRAPSIAAPDGMARVGSVANAPWFNLRNGNLLYGKLINIYDRPDERAKSGRSKFFQVEVMEYKDPKTGEVVPCEARTGRGKNADLVEVLAGSVVNLNYGPKTKDLEKFIPEILQGAGYNVWILVDGDKFDIGKGQTMWPIDCRAIRTRSPLVQDEVDFGSDDDMPEAPADNSSAPATPAS